MRLQGTALTGPPLLPPLAPAQLKRKLLDLFRVCFGQLEAHSAIKRTILPLIDTIPAVWNSETVWLMLS